MANINEFLQKHGSVLSQEIDRRILPKSPWLRLPAKKAWPEEMSHTMRTVMWERSLPNSITSWSDINTPDGTGNPCLPSVDIVEFNQTVRLTNLQTKAIESPRFCVSDLRVDWKRDQQMSLVTETLSEVTSYYWIDRNRDGYVAACNNKVVFDAALTTTAEAAGDSFAASMPTSYLTNGILDYFYAFLLREGASEFALTHNGGQPIFGLICSVETSRRLVKGNDAVREDFRQSSRRDELLKALGYSHTYNGYLHMIDATPRRFDFVTGAWVRRDPWVLVGNKWEQNPEYINAEVEDTIIWVDDVYRSYVPMSTSSVGKAKFNAQNYVGEYKFLNIPHETENPDGTIGFFRGVLANGFQTRHSEFGVTIRHLRCPIDVDHTACPA